ncbi:MAG: fructokinase [Acidobacteriaceae bacterium]|jgi:fructokinase|nr:fructokinase [Acidobacteriaceae bacterium]
MTDGKHTIVGLGELLWDLLPAGKQLGGAPANFAYITNLLGNKGVPASRVGNDSLGDAALQRLTQLGVSTEFVQRDALHPTGSVNVEIDRGQPRFEILQSVAWDFLDWSQPWQRLAADADAVCFGSLAQRSAQSQSTIRSFLNATRPRAVRVFDVNLRQNFYSRQVLAESMRLATIVKLNHEELPKIMHLFEIASHGEMDSAQRLLSMHDLKLVCITRGDGGSLLISANECSEHAGIKVKVADTVGAGDAFTAAMVHGYLRGSSLKQINESANRVGAWVASQPGAMPVPKLAGLPQTLAEIA